MRKTKKMRLKARIGSVFILGVLIFSSDVFADTPQLSVNVDPKDEYTPSRKLGRGIANASFGWAETLKGVAEVRQHDNPIAAMTWGVVEGVKNAAVRTATGFYEIATFSTAGKNHYKPLIEPEFVFSADLDDKD